MRISDWSSDVCSSDLEQRTIPGRTLRPSGRTHRCGPPAQPILQCHGGSGKGWFVSAVRDAHQSGREMRAGRVSAAPALVRSEEHTSELQSLMRNSYAVVCLKNNTGTRDSK